MFIKGVIPFLSHFVRTPSNFSEKYGTGLKRANFKTSQEGYQNRRILCDLKFVEKVTKNLTQKCYLQKSAGKI